MCVSLINKSTLASSHDMMSLEQGMERAPRQGKEMGRPVKSRVREAVKSSVAATNRYPQFTLVKTSHRSHPAKLFPNPAPGNRKTQVFMVLRH